MARSVAVFVDGENASVQYANKIRKIAAQNGDVSILRVYGDVQRTSDWHSALGYNVIHSGTGKNAADILIAIDAIETLLTKDIRQFILVSSDLDFTHVATRLREHQATVIGVGETKAPHMFRAACSEFVELSPLISANNKPETTSELDHKVRCIIAEHSEKGAGMRISELAPKMHTKHNIRISTFPEKRWRGYLAARPELYDLDKRGPDAMVRFKQQGFDKLCKM